MSKRKIYKILFVSAWAVVLVGITILLVSANKKNNDNVCKGLSVHIKGEVTKPITEEEIVFEIEKASKGALINRNIQSIDLPKLEKHLEREPWIKNAELYFDSKNTLNITIWERTPLARVFTITGTSFYIDDEGKSLPLINVPANLPVVTGFPAAKSWNVNDSAIFDGIKSVIHVMNTSPFWNAQIASIDITSNGEYELTPLVGNHRIKLGTSNNVEDKLHNVFIFYKQVASKVGFNKYSAINAAFKDQVVGEKKGTISPVDSLQLQKNIEELLKTKQPEPTIQQPEEIIKSKILPDNSEVTIEDIKPLRANSVLVKTKPSPIVTEKNATATPKKTVHVLNPIQKTKVNIKPKAVMPGKVVNEY